MRRGGIAAEVAVGRGEETAMFKDGKIEDKEEGDFSITFSFNNPSFRYLGKIFLPMSLQMLLSSIGRKSHLAEYNNVMRPQRVLTMIAKSLAGTFLLARLYLR